jgi:hypothetical protein
MKVSDSIYLFFILISIQSLAQPFVPMYPSMADGPVHWLDFDNDGDQDYVTILNRSFPPVPVLFSNENGSFTEIVGALEPHSGEIKVLDYDIDGDEDIVIYELYSGESKLYKNINGSFSQQSTIIGGSRVKWIDFDSDGDIDAISSNFQNIYLFENVNGDFIPHQTNIAFSDNLWDAGDFNKDGLVDLVVNYGEKAHIYFHQSDHSFVTDFKNDFPTWQSYLYVLVLDYDQDGDDDIFLNGNPNMNGDSRNFMLSNSDGLFALDSDPFYNTSSPINVDEDPFPEFVTYGNLEHYNRTANGSFEKINNRMLTDFFTVQSVSFSDNSRENSFVAVYGEVDPTLEGTFLYQIRNGTPVPIYHNPFDRVDGSTVKIVDFDNDGWKDICLSTPFYKGAQLLKNTQTGFAEVGRLPLNFNALGRHSQWVDFDRDGKMDLISGIERDIWQASGFSEDVNNLSLKKIISGWSQKGNFNVVDFDKDRDMDILVENLDEGMYVNENGLLNLRPTLFPYGVIGLSAWSDYDRDGDLDVVMANRYLKKNGSTFSEVADIFPNQINTTPITADFNLDGYPDLFQIGQNYNSMAVGLYYNNNGVFQSVNTDVFNDLKNELLYSYHTEIVDFDVDGYPDICFMGDTYNSRTPITRLFRNNKGTFEVFVNHGLPEIYGANFHWDDIDNDGDPDLLLSGYKYYSIITQLYRNEVINASNPTPSSTEASSKIYPNPATSLLTISLTGFQYLNSVNMIIYDSYGRTVSETTLNNRKTEIELGDLKPGLYILLLHQGGLKNSHIFIKN